MRLPNIKGKPVTNLRRLDPNRAIFSGRAGRVEMIVKQPDPRDDWRVKQGAMKCSAETMRRFIMLNMPVKKPGDPKTICDYPPFKTGDLGYLFLIMLIEEEVVGFGRHLYVHARDHDVYKIPNPDDVIADCALCIVDDYQGRGLGTLYGHINKFVCKSLGAKWLVGTTFVQKGMMKIRQRDGFDIVDVLDNGKQVRVRGKL